MTTLPGPVRAALGLVATALDTARTLPEKAPEIPMLAVTTALQYSLRSQQRYAELMVRGDELIGRIRGVPDEAPAWATFDDDEPADEPLADAGAETAARPPTPAPSVAAKKGPAKKAAAKKVVAPKPVAAAKATKKGPAKKAPTPPSPSRSSAFDLVDEQAVGPALTEDEPGTVS